MALSTIGTAAIADDAVTSAKVDSTTTAFTVADLVVTNGISAGTDIVGNISGRILLDASASGTDVGDEFLLDGTDGSATNAGSKIVFEEGTDDPNTVLNSSDVGIGSNITFLNSTATKFNTIPDGLTMDLLLNSTISSAVAQFDVSSTHINSTYDDYVLYATLIGATDNTNLIMQVFENSTILAGDKYSFECSSNSASSYLQSNAVHRFGLNTIVLGNSAGEGITMKLNIHNVNSITQSFCYGGQSQTFYTDATPTTSNMCGALLSTERNVIVNGLRISFESGNIASGIIKVYGIRT